ncbi:MAG: DNA polymerase III subunit beta, partial [Candidatus Pacearchaeota archaeon]|nr:DNA polymerase III subunit beta [Candidatus Pacearchaeota archaeon]
IFMFTKENKQEHQIILPGKAVRELISILSERTGRVKIYVSGHQAAFEYIAGDNASSPQIQIISRLIEGEYPPYREVIPTTHSTKVVVEKAQFLNQIKASAIFTGKKEEVRLTCDPSKKGVTITSKSPDLGESESFLQGKVEGEKMAISFNWRFLAEGLAQIKGGEVQLLLNGEEGPALLVPTEEEQYRYVIMPIKA